MTFWDSSALAPLLFEERFQLAAALVVTGDRPVGNLFLTADARLRLAAQTENFDVL